MFGKIALIILLSLSSLFIPPSAYSEAPLRIAYPVFPPFHWVKEDGEMAGLFYEIINEALHKRMGISVVWTAYPWPRCQENVKTGKEDAILTVPTAERLQYTITHETPFFEKSLDLFTYAGNQRMEDIKKIRSLSDIKQFELSMITYSGNGWHKENVEPLGIKTYETPYLVNVWKMLAERRADIVIEWPPGAWHDIKESGRSEQIVDTGISIASMPFYLLIRKNSPYTKILVEFNSTIIRMEEDGTIKMILSKYY